MLDGLDYFKLLRIGVAVVSAVGIAHFLIRDSFLSMSNTRMTAIKSLLKNFNAIKINQIQKLKVKKIRFLFLSANNSSS